MMPKLEDSLVPNLVSWARLSSLAQIIAFSSYGSNFWTQCKRWSLIEAKSRSTRIYPRAPNSGYKTASNSCTRCCNFHQLNKSSFENYPKLSPQHWMHEELALDSLVEFVFCGWELIIYFQLLGTNVFPELVCRSLLLQYYLNSYSKWGSLDCSISRATCIPSFFVCIISS
jgi:hypothetical protein